MSILDMELVSIVKALLLTLMVLMLIMYYLSIHNGNRLAENVLILGKGLIQKINKQKVYAGYTFSTNFTVTDKTFCLTLHYDGLISRLFVNGKKQVVFKAKYSEITSYKMYLGNLSTDLSATNLGKTSLY